MDEKYEVGNGEDNNAVGEMVEVVSFDGDKKGGEEVNDKTGSDEGEQKRNENKEGDFFTGLRFEAMIDSHHSLIIVLID